MTRLELRVAEWINRWRSLFSIPVTRSTAKISLSFSSNEDISEIDN